MTCNYSFAASALKPSNIAGEVTTGGEGGQLESSEGEGEDPCLGQFKKNKGVLLVSDSI